LITRVLAGLSSLLLRSLVRACSPGSSDSSLIVALNATHVLTFSRQNKLHLIAPLPVAFALPVVLNQYTNNFTSELLLFLLAVIRPHGD
jgi:hypothetical protein